MKRFHVIGISFLLGLVCGLAVGEVKAAEVSPADIVYQCSGGILYQDIHQGQGALVYVKGVGQKAYSILLGEHDFNQAGVGEDNVGGVFTVEWDNEKGADVTTIETKGKLVVVIDGLSEICVQKNEV
ncbi:UNVERIFIED_CONTAM: hypothetical protein RF648_19315 [Kocuria sp. CPCC 205274]|uniref:C-type lysozyme inhibitor domain-containing protein n=1 Tax=Herbiconiux daphne TaxID=2970914 RepID=A0ABT2H907_9MICO|nr:hypothetical protein [Herbiconiux daphne]MCS5736440.1 hypothetical protein [Herbiconiux daphne]